MSLCPGEALHKKSQIAPGAVVSYFGISLRSTLRPLRLRGENVQAEWITAEPQRPQRLRRDEIQTLPPVRDA